MPSWFKSSLLIFVVSSVAVCAQGPSCPLPPKPHKSSRYNFSSSENSRLNDFVARSKQVGGDFKAATALVADFLDEQPDLSASSQTRLAGVGAAANPSDQIVGCLRDISQLGLGEPDWRRSQILSQFPNLDGFSVSTDYTTLYLHGKRSHAVRIYRDGRVEALDSITAVTEYRDFCRRDIRKHSSPEMELFNVEALQNGGREIYIGGKTLTIAPAEYSALQRGKALPEGHPLTIALRSQDGRAKVLYSNPMMQKPGSAMQHADEFAFALQKAYPDVPIYRDPLSAKTNALAKGLNDFTISGPNDVVAIVAEDSFRPRPKDYNVIQDLKSELEKAKVRVISYRPGTRLASSSNAGKGLIIITGHSSPELAAFVRELGAQGAFKNSYVLFNSCETPLSRQLIMEINTRYEALATFAQQGKIQVDDLDLFMGHFANELMKPKKASFREIIMRSLEEGNLNGVWTICSLFEEFHA